MIERDAGFGEYRFQIFQYLDGLFLDAALNFGSSFGVYRNLAGGVEQVAAFNRLIVWADRSRSFWGCDDFFHSILPFL